jgi:hypothetical protein
MSTLQEVKKRVQARGAKRAYNDYAFMLDYVTGAKRELLNYKLFLVSAGYLSLILK